SWMGLPVAAVGWDAWCSHPRGWCGAVRAMFEEVRFGQGSEMGGETDAGDGWDMGLRGVVCIGGSEQIGEFGVLFEHVVKGAGRRRVVGGNEGGEAGMVGGDVEAAGGGDEFASRAHAQKHFASGFIVVAGGSEDGFDGLRSSAG